MIINNSSGVINLINDSNRRHPPIGPCPDWAPIGIPPGPPLYRPPWSNVPGYPVILPIPGRPIIFPIGLYPYPGRMPWGPGPSRPPWSPGYRRPSWDRPGCDDSDDGRRPNRHYSLGPPHV